MAWILTEAGYEVEVEAKVDDGVRRAGEQRPDVVVLNTSMDTEETARWIARMHAAAPRAHVVDMVKASGRVGHPARGAVAALVAPFDADALLSVVGEAAGEGGARPEG
jgi:DNA-binding NtrC family response regulator